MRSTTRFRGASSRLLESCGVQPQRSFKRQECFWILRSLTASLIIALPQTYVARTETIKVPSLEKLLINCLSKSVQGHQACLCGSFQEDPCYSQFYLGKEAAPVLALSVQAFVTHYPQLTHILLIDSGQLDYEDHSVYSTFNRRNIMHNKIYCMPLVNIPPFQPDEELWKASSSEGFMLPAQFLEG
ncbi:b999949b-fec9-40f6-a43c-ed3da387b808-CDS [Sclerotinia trifoliorum]|uniref:B999949b-fec9-40f6-a43c-ed3da387b808-CDS n=1 Tax=Sclerotinia trifoliorum TaxID=28548 RepID=A0A8H2ZS90_9HELO|nr:b999949b-fec9-40f6-a43c-ed3da387b808-CDS [Sclerotinia trifoliorum]